MVKVDVASILSILVDHQMADVADVGSSVPLPLSSNGLKRSRNIPVVACGLLSITGLRGPLVHFLFSGIAVVF